MLSVLCTGQTPDEMCGKIIRQATLPRAIVMMSSVILEPGSIIDAVAAQMSATYCARPVGGDSALQEAMTVNYEQVNRVCLPAVVQIFKDDWSGWSQY